MNLRALIGILFLCILVLVVGVGLGILWKGGGTTTVPTETQTQTQAQIPSNLVNILSSKIVPSITARGALIKIEGKNLTLNYQTDNRTIKMADDVKVYQLVTPTQTGVNKGQFTYKQVVFGDIKIKDNLEITMRVLPSGQLEGFNMIILSSAPVTLTTTTTK